MSNQHPIVPSPKQVDQWFDDAVRLNSTPKYYIARQSALWSADQELEACCSEMDGWGDIHYSAGWKFSKNLRTARRPSLKEQALHILYTHGDLTRAEADTISQALEALDD